MHQNLAVILLQLHYGKNSFIILIPDRKIEKRSIRRTGQSQISVRAFTPHFNNQLGSSFRNKLE